MGFLFSNSSLEKKTLRLLKINSLLNIRIAFGAIPY